MAVRLVREWMTPNPVTVLPTTRVTEAYELMRERQVRRLPVVEGGKLIGIVTLGDLRRVNVDTDNTEASKMRVELVMTRDPLTVIPDTTLRDAAKVMIRHKVSGLPVMDGNAVVGMITESDIFRAIMLEDMPELAPEIPPPSRRLLHA
jgi:acetoin utilization protein AcuB